MNKVATIREIVDHAAVSYGSRPAFSYKENKAVSSKSFQEVKGDSDAFGRTLQRQGLAGAHVAVLGPTSYEWVIAYLGTANSGGVIVPIDRELSAADICELLCRADVSALVFDTLYTDVVKEIKAQCPGIKAYFDMQLPARDDFAQSLRQCLAENRGELTAQVDPDALCAILFTSGTTGKSKGVMLTHRNIAENATCEDMGIDGPNTTILTVLPIHHAYCFTCDILMGIYLGVNICINDSIMRLTKNLQLFRPTLILLVPMIIESIYARLCEAAQLNPGVPKSMVAGAALGGRLSTIYSGGAYLNPALVGGFQEFGITLLQGYGMTEYAPRVSTNFLSASKTGSVGRLMPGCEVKVVEGELWVKGPSVMRGYYKDPAETAAALEDGWLKTGDLGYVDEDHFLYITGRKKNLIILSNGENVSPEELENRLGVFPEIAEVIVYGENGVITAEIYPNEEYARQNGITDLPAAVQACIDKANETLPVSRRVHGLKLRDREFEKTTSKKIKRTHL